MKSGASGAQGPISVAYGNIPAPGLRNGMRYCGVMFLPARLRVPCGLGGPKNKFVELIILYNRWVTIVRKQPLGNNR